MTISEALIEKWKITPIVDKTILICLGVNVFAIGLIKSYSRIGMVLSVILLVWTLIRTVKRLKNEV